jgi:hypothetical protein
MDPLMTFDELDNEQKVVALYLQGKKLREIAAEVFGTKSIVRLLSILVKHPESGYKPGRRTNRPRKYHFDQAFFEQVDNEAKAYFFGWICSDGWIKYQNGIPLAVCLEIQSRDREVLEAWRGLMGEKAPPITERVHKDGSRKARLVFHSTKMAHDLERLLGCGHDKTHDLGDVTGAVPPELMRHFVRGVCDGDGSAFISPYRLRITFRGTKAFLEALKQVIPEPMQLTIGNQKWPSLHTNTHRAACRLAYWMYYKATYLLTRKWIKCQSGFVPRGPKKNSEYRWKPSSG